MSILIPREDKRPRVVCPHCKTEVIVDIRPFNEDMTRLAEFICVNLSTPILWWSNPYCWFNRTKINRKYSVTCECGKCQEHSLGR